MEHQIAIRSVNKRATQLIGELSNSIAELSYSIEERSNWIGYLSNWIRVSIWIAEISNSIKDLS